MDHPQYGALYNGIPTMNQVTSFFKKFQNFIRIFQGWQDVLDMYESENDVDLYVGLLFEIPTNGNPILKWYLFELYNKFLTKLYLWDALFKNAFLDINIILFNKLQNSILALYSFI